MSSEKLWAIWPHQTSLTPEDRLGEMSTIVWAIQDLNL